MKKKQGKPFISNLIFCISEPPVLLLLSIASMFYLIRILFTRYVGYYPIL